MRKLLLLLVLGLLVGASAVWVLQFGSGYVLLSFAEFTIEMSVWTGLLIYVAATATAVLVAVNVALDYGRWRL